MIVTFDHSGKAIPVFHPSTSNFIQIYPFWKGVNSFDIHAFSLCRPTPLYCVYRGPIEEGRAASKSPHETFGYYFLSTSQQDVSADIIQNSAVKNFSQKQKEQRQKHQDVSFF